MYLTGDSGDAVYQYSTGAAATLTVPASVQNPPTQAIIVGDRVAYEFFTLDGGTNVYLIDEGVL